MKKVVSTLLILIVLSTIANAQINSFGFKRKQKAPINYYGNTVNSLINKNSEKKVVDDKNEYHDYHVNKWFKFFPCRNVDQSRSYFDNSDTLITTAKDSGFFNFDHAYMNYLIQSKSYAAYTEITYDYFGPVRMSVGMLLMTPYSKDSANQTNEVYNKQRFLDRFKSGGGNIITSFVLPFITSTPNKYVDLKSNLVGRFSLDVPQEDTSYQRFAHNTQLGIETQLTLTSDEEKIKLFFNNKYMSVWGNSTFMDNINLKGDNRKRFDLSTWSIGASVKGAFTIYYTWYSGSSTVIDNVTNNGSLTVHYTF